MGFLWIVLYFIQHPPFDSIVSEDAGIEHKTVLPTGWKSTELVFLNVYEA